MEIIRYDLSDSFTLPKNFRNVYKDIPFAIFDIETTGLNPQYNKVILIGILYSKDTKIIIEQLFCNSRNEEIDLLERFIKRIKDIPLLISYNGDSFDIPFLTKRIEINKITARIPRFCSLDLLKFVRNFQLRFNLKDCRLKSVEKHLGIDRQDQINGKESVELYNRFENTGEKHLKDLILLHNHDDLRYLFKVLSILDNVSHEALISSIPHMLTCSNEMLCVINKSYIKNNTLSVSGLLLSDNMDEYILHQPGFSFNYNADNQRYLLQVPLYKVVLDSKEKCFYINTNEYSFHYHSRLENNTLLPDNIILLKKDKHINIVDIYGFSTELLTYIIENLSEASSA